MSVSQPGSIGLSSEIIEVKLILLNIKELLTSLESIMELRCNNIVKLIASSSKGQQMADIYNHVSTEFNMLKDEILASRDKAKCFVKNLEIKLKQSQTLTTQVRSSIPELAGEHENHRFRSTIRCSTADDRKLADNLRAMLLVVENFEKENSKLKEDNMKLSNQLFELLHAHLGSRKDEKIQPVKPKPIRTMEKEDKKTSLTEIKEVVDALKEEIQSTFIIYIPYRSASELFFNPQDVSFNWNESETLELTEEEWRFRLNILKETSEEMALTEAKLTTIKTAAPK